ncbi:MAG: DUF4258 domain-containing protein [Candidatus Latescibacterota bacterium]
MEYILTIHAREALEKRQILPEWMDRTVVSPEWTEKDPVDENLEHRMAHIPEFGNRVLRVIVNVTTNPLRIVTVYFDRRRKLFETENRS